MNLIDYAAGRYIPINYTIDNDKHMLKFPFSRAIINDIRACEDATWNPDEKQWTIKSPELSLRNAVILGFLSKGEYPNSIKNPFKFITSKEEINYTPKRPLKKHQYAAVKKALKLRRFYLAHEMGLGKTLTSIEIIEHLNNDNPWIIAPKAPLRAWHYELNKWKARFVPKLINSSAAAIERAILEAHEPPQVLILDESVEYKTPKSARSQYVIQLRDLMFKHYGYDNYYIIAACGTPSPNRVSDWWNQIEILWPGLLPYKNIHQLNKAIADVEEMEGLHGTYSKIKGYRPADIQILSKKLDQIRDVRFKKDCIDIPPMDYQTINVPCNNETLAAARLVVETSVTTVEALIKLRQISDGFMYNKSEDDLRTTDFVNNAKLNVLKDELELRRLNEKNRIVIYGAFQATIDLIKDAALQSGWHVIRADGRGWQTFLCSDIDGIENFTASQAQFQDNDLDKPIAFIGNPASVGMGLTLDASDEAWYYSNTYNTKDRYQSEQRIQRMKNNKVIIKDFIHLPTDTEIIERLKSKQDIQNMSLGQLIEKLK